MKKPDKILNINVVMWRKLCPYLPIIGLFLTVYYHNKYGDTGIENNKKSWITAFIQAYSVFALIIILIHLNKH